MKSPLKFVPATLAAVLFAAVGLFASACSGAEPTATAIPTPIPTATATAVQTATPTATAVPTPTPDPALAPFLAALEARETGPIPKGSFVGYTSAGITGNSATLAFGSDGRITSAGPAFPGKYTSTDNVLFIVGLWDDLCGQSPAIYNWSFDGEWIRFITVEEPCGVREQALADRTWKRPF